MKGMRNKFLKAANNIKRFVLNVVTDKTTLLSVLIAESVFWSPLIVTAVLAVIYSPKMWGAVGAIVAFWCMPFTPAVALQIGLVALIRGLIIKFKKRRIKKNGEERRG